MLILVLGGEMELKNNMNKLLNASFFERSAVVVAEGLLGKYLVRKTNGKEIAFKITEVEAYEGLEDLASHASRGRTKRTEIMFGPAGHFYVYLCYGMYWMLNVVTGSEGHPAAVLIRGTAEISGPGRLTKHLKIDKKLNGVFADKKSGLWFEDRGVVIPKNQITKTARIGVSYAGPVWSKKEWRFVWKGDK